MSSRTGERDTGIYLSVFGFGSGNYNDALMQTLAQNGNGVAAYIDTLNEARRVLRDQVGVFIEYFKARNDILVDRRAGEHIQSLEQLLESVRVLLAYWHVKVSILCSSLATLIFTCSPA